MLITTVATCVAASATVIYTVGTFMLWHLTRKNIVILEKQFKKQETMLYSTAQTSALESHRNLYVTILQDPQLLRLFSAQDNISDQDARSNLLSTLLINHTRRVYMDFSYESLNPLEKESFELDARGLFAMPFVRERWARVEKYHPKRFQEFVNDRCLGDTV